MAAVPYGRPSRDPIRPLLEGKKGEVLDWLRLPSQTRKTARHFHGTLRGIPLPQTKRNGSLSTQLGKGILIRNHNNNIWASAPELTQLQQRCKTLPPRSGQ
eukprot:EG_transcript_63519